MWAMSQEWALTSMSRIWGGHNRHFGTGRKHWDGRQLGCVPMILAALGVFASIIGTFLVRTGEKVEQSLLLSALRRGGVNVSAVIVVVASWFAVRAILGTDFDGL